MPSGLKLGIFFILSSQYTSQSLLDVVFGISVGIMDYLTFHQNIYEVSSGGLPGMMMAVVGSATGRHCITVVV